MQHRILIALATIVMAVIVSTGPIPLRAAENPRNLIVFFEFKDNTNGVENAVEYIFNRMIGPGDQLIIQTPVKVYGFSPKTLSRPKAELIAMMKEKLRGDISRAGQSYKQVIQDLEVAARNIAAFAYPDLASDGGLPETRDMNELFVFYRQALANLNQLRKVNDASLRQISAAFRGQKGENHIIILLEREFRPIPRREALNALAEMPKFAFQANELFATGNMNEPFAVEALAEYFKQVPLTQHFVYITSKQTSTSGNLFENSGDIYSAFSKIANATGGVSATVGEPVAGLEAITKAWKGGK